MVDGKRPCIYGGTFRDKIDPSKERPFFVTYSVKRSGRPELEYYSDVERTKIPADNLGQARFEIVQWNAGIEDAITRAARKHRKQVDKMNAKRKAIRDIIDGKDHNYQDTFDYTSFEAPVWPRKSRVRKSSSKKRNDRARLKSESTPSIDPDSDASMIDADISDLPTAATTPKQRRAQATTQQKTTSPDRRFSERQTPTRVGKGLESCPAVPTKPKVTDFNTKRNHSHTITPRQAKRHRTASNGDQRRKSISEDLAAQNNGSVTPLRNSIEDRDEAVGLEVKQRDVTPPTITTVPPTNLGPQLYTPLSLAEVQFAHIGPRIPSVLGEMRTRSFQDPIIREVFGWLPMPAGINNRIYDLSWILPNSSTSNGNDLL